MYEKDTPYSKKDSISKNSDKTKECTDSASKSKEFESLSTGRYFSDDREMISQAENGSDKQNNNKHDEIGNRGAYNDQ
jgi:hypothetical protein